VPTPSGFCPLVRPDHEFRTLALIHDCGHFVKTARIPAGRIFSALLLAVGEHANLFGMLSKKNAVAHSL
jgi:hypothetical protein